MGILKKLSEFISTRAAENNCDEPRVAMIVDPEIVFDPMFVQAVDAVLDTQVASLSFIQRRLRIGYARGSMILDQMEEVGIVGPFNGNAPREILMTRKQWQEIREQCSNALPF